MKPFASLAASVVLLGCLAFALDRGPEGSKPRAVAAAEGSRVGPTADRDSADAPLIVHEWGTFTSFSGSDGVKLEFRPLVENDLPGFVSNRAKVSGRWFGKSTLTALQRMETPVTYFYTEVERDVTVKVEFPEGLLTEFYPPVRGYAPLPDDNWANIYKESHVATAPPLKDSMLDWGRVHLIPTTSLRAQVDDGELSRRIGRHVERTMVPEADRFKHYAAARATDSAIVQVRHQGGGQDNNAVDYFEKFLFYRGVGNFKLPLTLTENEEGNFTLENAGAEDVRSLFLLHVAGEQVQFHQYAGIAAHSRLTLTRPKNSSTIDHLAAAMVSSLVDEGLYEKEARAMVACWKASWFGEEGTRLLYMVPGDITETLLPLHIDPQPEERVRVLVGRMEFMPTSQEHRVIQLVESSRAARMSASTDEQKSFRSPSLSELQALGRLAEPALIRARHIATNDDLRTEAMMLIADLQAERK